MFKNIIVIGNTGLCLECCKLLKKAHFKILAVVSEDPLLQTWAKQALVDCLTFQQFKQATQYQHYVLFSIINHHLIPQALLQKHQAQLAVNYHDSPLPRYAGVNSTTWAILNHEKQHGVTWHKIDSGIDTGDILKKAVFDISEDETAYSLNLKCTNQALSLFKELLVDLAAGKLKDIKQDLSERSYYGRNHIPVHYGFLNNCSSLHEIERVCRSLYFGEVVNPIATPKIKLNKHIYLLQLPQWVDKPNPNKHGLYIQDRQNFLYFSRVFTAYGKQTTLNRVITLHELQNQSVVLTQDSHYQLTAIRKSEREYHAYLATVLKSQVPIFSGIKKSNSSLTDVIHHNNQDTNGLVAAIIMVLFRVTQQASDITVYLDDQNLQLPEIINKQYYFAATEALLTESFAIVKNLIYQSSLQALKLPRDFFYRYHLMDYLPDVGIYLHCDSEQDSPHRLTFTIIPEYIRVNGSEFAPLTFKAITSALQTILENNLNHLDHHLVKDITLISQQDYQHMIIDWNQTDHPYPQDKTIHALFEAQVLKTPDNTALVFEDQSLTYRQLNIKANQLARYLRQQVEVKPDILIALFLDRGLDMIVAMLAVLKAGGAYVPLDPSYPEARVRYILEDTKVPVVLTQSYHLQYLSTLTQCLCIALGEKCDEKAGTENLTPLSNSNDLAYVIYTSGTTGHPKGVCIRNKSLVNLAVLQQQVLSLNINSRVMQFLSFSFDGAVWEIFSALISGAKLYVINEGDRNDLLSLGNYIFDQKINTASFLVPVLSCLDVLKLKYLERLVIAGSTCSETTIQLFQDKKIFINSYGPTETTVCATIRRYQAGDCANNIGKPIHNTKCYVLDHYNQPVPIGVIGELYIAGAGLARGYLNQPELTATKFIPNPFATDSDIAKGYTRLYKTGDLVRWLPEGNLEYIGRNDFQVKIRGYRIELGEIESALLELQEIQQAIVIAHQRSKETSEDKYLVGYVTTSNNGQLNTDAVLHTLSQQLPEYMVPTALVQLETLPLTINGKVDRKALPLPQLTQKRYVAPSNAEEILIYQAFAEILQIDKVSVTDDFFKLGGNSISAIRLSVVLQQNFDIHLSEIFELRTPQNIAKDRTITPGALKNKLLNLKKQRQETLSLDSEAEAKIKQYQQSVKKLKPQKFTTKPINNVLLTGSAGFLGCNLLNQLLQLTHYTIYVFIRAKDKSAVIKRMEHKFQFYFEQSLQETYPSRVIFIPCDLEEPYLGLSSNQYEALASEIDTVIHAAALTKHYGVAETLRSANVDATINLLKFTQLTRLKDFHYISTHSVSEVMRQNGSKSYVFTEDDHPEPSGTWATIYNQTKYLGEQYTRTYRSKGIQTNIYRIGNLAYSHIKHPKIQN